MNTIKYKFLKDDKWLDVVKEKWCWEAYFNDGTVLKQFGEDGIFHQFNEINQKKLRVFKMVSDDHPEYTLIFDNEKMKLIHYYKRFRLRIGEDDETSFTVYCFGYKTKIFGKINKVITMITPTGEVIITQNPDIINFE